MKKSILIASFAALAFIAGCSDNADSKSDTGSMGVVGETKKSGCCSQKSECADKPAEGSMGVVSEKESGACESKKSCEPGATCPYSGKSDQKN